MSDYSRKRELYINNWPDSIPFEVEQEYMNKCRSFLTENGKHVFYPMKVWQDDNIGYQRDISHIIQSLEMMPFFPNNAFLFIFSGLDYWEKRTYSDNNTTKNLKKSIEEINVLALSNDDVAEVIEVLYNIVPFRAVNYLFEKLLSKPEIAARVSSDGNGQPILGYKQLIDEINQRYTVKTPNNIRNGSMLYRHLMISKEITLSGNTIAVPNELKLRIALLGLVYSLRNDFAHGSAMASTKSSKTTIARYSMQFYCFVLTYTLFMLLLILHSDMSDQEKNRIYADLKSTTIQNAYSFKLLFGHNLTK